MSHPAYVVLVHGAGGSAHTWSLVAPLLASRGIAVTTIDHASRSHTENVAAVRDVLDRRPEDAVLVGHSYGGAVITDAGRHERARALVYVAAFAPTAGECIDDITATHGRAEVFQNPPAPAALAMPGSADEDWERHSWDVPERVRATAPARRSISEEIYLTPCEDPAWRTVPSRYIVASLDRHLLPTAQRAMAERAGAATIEVPTSHSVPHAAPEVVAREIEAAVAAVRG